MSTEPTVPAGEDVRQLLTLTSDLESVARRLSGQSPVEQPDAERVRIATVILRSRARRAVHMPDVEFGEPAWDMLLELYVGEATGKPLSVSSLCHASRVPPTTALRWIAMLTELGYFGRERDEGDARRIFVRLSAKGRGAVEAWLDEAAGLGL